MWTVEQIELENSKMKTTDIQGKGYAEVNQRIKAFRRICPNGTIQTELISNENGVAIFRASVLDEDGKLLGTGTAYEKEGAGFINKTSYIENCETSAVGRALGMCGIGVEKAFASYEEVANAKLQQKPQKAQPQKNDAVVEAEYKAKVLGYINRHKMSNENIAKICKCYKVEKIQDLTQEQCQHYIKMLEKNGGNIDE